VSRQPSIEAASDHSLLVSFGDRIERSLHERVRALAQSLLATPAHGVVNVHPAYASVLIDFRPLEVPLEDMEEEVRSRIGQCEMRDATESRLMEVPVCYGGEFGPDLGAVARHCGLTEDQVIARHAAAEYLVYFLGFSPGFPYLGGMDPALETPRQASPRKSVAAGSVAIGGNQTGIYPLASPGGWRIIGRTPLRLFDARRRPPELLRMGDSVRFRAIAASEFAAHATEG
jgi:KipI family sensor histidine kinase inhibitor